MNQYPAKPFMDQMAQYGRYGDSMLVHMNPVEVAGIAALSPTGQLTTNPVTGQPEAFLPLLAPALGWLGGSLGLGALGTAALTGIGTAAVTGDLKRGLLAGLTAGAAGGIGDLFAGSAEAATQAGVEAATQAATEGATQAATEGLSQAVIDAGGTDFVGQAGNIAEQLSQAGVTPQDYLQEISATARQVPQVDYVAAADAVGSQVQDVLNPSVTDQLVAKGVTPFGGETFQGMQLGAENLSDRMGGFGSLLATTAGAGQLAEMDYMDEMKALGRAQEEESLAEKQRAYDALQGAYAAAQPGLVMGLSPYRAGMSYNTPAPYYPGMAEGGSTSYDEFLASIEPTEREQQALDRAAGSQPLTAEDQTYLEDFYNRRSYELQQRQEQAAASAPPSTIGEYFGTATAPETGGRDASAFAAPRGAAIRQMMDGGNPFGMAGMFGGMGGNRGYGGIDPVSVQAGLRGREVVAPPRDYMAGFEPEFSYFQDDAANPMIPSREYRPIKQGFGAPVFDPILEPTEYQKNVSNYFAMLGAPGTGSVIDSGPQVTRTDRYTPPPPKDPGDVVPDPSKPTAGAPDFTNTDWLNWMKGQGAMTDKELDWIGRWFSESGTGGHKNWVTGDVQNYNWAESDLTKQNKGIVNKAINYMKPFWEEKQPKEEKAAGGRVGMQEGGMPPERSTVSLKGPMGPVEVPAGGIAEVDSGMSATPSELEVGALAAALLGQIENADDIIAGFLDQYGPEIFNMVREFVLQTMMPDAQTSGMIEGAGGGMDDMVPGMIGSQQPVAVSPGEYIIPADVVSDLGDGSSDAGAAELDAMLGRVRMARGGTADQPPAINAQAVMPA